MLRSPARAPLGGLSARYLIACTALAVLVPAGFPVPPVAGARTQEPEAGAITLELVAQPVAYDAKDDLGIEVRVSNAGTEELPGFILNVERESRLTSRSDLQSSFESPPGIGLATTPLQIVTKDLRPGESRVVALDEPVTELLTPGFDEEGIYPATVNLLDSNGATALDSLTTHLMFYPDETESRLNFVLAVPLNDLPARAPDGTFAFDVSGDQPTLEQAVSERGWLTETVRELNRLGGRRLRLGLAPTPRLVEEIADMSDGYRRGDEQVPESAPEAGAAAAFLDDLSELVRTPGVQPLLVPYANPDLPSLAAGEVDDHVGTQITLGETVLGEALDVEVDRAWIFPPGGRMSSEALELLQSAAAERTFFAGSSLEKPPNPLLSGCPIETLSSTCPVSVATQFGDALGYQADSGLQNRLTALVRDNDERLNLQRFFAETAMIRQEQPGRTDRIVQATLPSMWHPEPRLMRTLLRGLASAPWLNTVTPQEGLDLGIAPVERRVTDDAVDVSNELNVLDYAAIAEAEAMVESFNSVDPPSSLYQRLLHNYLVAESRNWWMDEELADRGVDYVRASLDEARSEMNKVSIEVNERITLTSRGEDIPVRVLNDTGYPVKVRFQLNSPKLRFADEKVQTFDSGRTPLTIPVRAESSGIFRVTMALVTPDGSEVIAESEPSVRSTEFNNIALAITVGALLFLIVFYALRWYRRRSASTSQEAA
ncbi:MAG: DUF6049 family protein [Actinomycetota bacterium]